MKHNIRVMVNDKPYEQQVSSRMLLVYFLRDKLGLTGTRIGCDTGHCGACTVLLDGKSVKSCMVFAVQADGKNVRTIEGLTENNGELSPIQTAFCENEGFQCGYCTSGMIMSTCYLLSNNPNPAEHEIRRGIEGNICRCTGYVNIIRSIRAAAAKVREKNPRLKQTERLS